MNITGNKKQEDKIIYLGKVAKKMFPEISKVLFDEIFRHGIEAALKEHNYNQWSDVLKEQPVTRKNFFESILKESKTYLQETGLKEDQIKKLIIKLGKKNRRYLG